MRGFKLAIIFMLSVGLWSCTDERQEELNRQYVGTTVPFDQFDKIGAPQTLKGTNNEVWIVYFAKADFTIVSRKSDNTILRIYPGQEGDLVARFDKK